MAKRLSGDAIVQIARRQGYFLVPHSDDSADLRKQCVALVNSGRLRQIPRRRVEQEFGDRVNPRAGIFFQKEADGV